MPAQAHTRRSQPRRQGGNAGSFLLLELPTGVCPPVSGRRNRLARPVAMKKAFWGSFHKTGGGKSHWSRRGESRVGMPGPLQWGKMWEDGLREYLGHSRISNSTHAGASDVSKAWFSKKNQDELWTYKACWRQEGAGSAPAPSCSQRTRVPGAALLSWGWRLGQGKQWESLPDTGEFRKKNRK